MSEPVAAAAPIHFSLVAGGPFHALLGRLGLLDGGELPTTRAAVWLAAAAWLPLAALVTIQSSLEGSGAAALFFADPTVHMRYLVAIGLLVATERYADRRLVALLRHFDESGLIRASDRPAFRAAVVRADERSASALAETAILLVAVAISVATTRYVVAVSGTGWEGRIVDGSVVLSWAGLVSIVFSNPLFLFLGLRWIWRFLVWTLLLIRISRLSLRLLPMHPDRSAGLGFLTIYPGIFSGYVFALSCVVASSFLKELRFVSHSWEEIALAIGTWLGLMGVVFLGPLLVFVVSLYRAREEGILAYGSVVARVHLECERRWLAGEATGRPIPDSPDPSFVADLNASVATIHDMRFVPIDVAAVVQLLASAGLPMLAVPIRQIPLADLVKWMLGTVL